jgi:transglutaminase-like putative cysteine protease
MKSLIIIMFMANLFSVFDDPLREVEDIKLVFPSTQHDIFLDYTNDNFSQRLVFHDQTVTAELSSSNFLKLNLNFRIFPQKPILESLSPKNRAIIKDLIGQDNSLKTFLTNISYYLEGNIHYSDENLPQDAGTVLSNQKANCIGYSNVVQLFLSAGNVKTRIVKGFYLQESKHRLDTWIPVPHRWVEIHLPNGVRFFYDPQHQRFAANYITTKNNVDFKQIRKFKVIIIRKSKKIVN